jgi:hypothetical protein
VGLYLNGLTSLSDEAAKSLARHRGYGLSLDGLETLSPIAAEALSASDAWDGDLSKMRTLSASTARALLKRKGPLDLSGVWNISPEALAVLKEKRNLRMRDSDQLTIVDEPEGSQPSATESPAGFQE